MLLFFLLIFYVIPSKSFWGSKVFKYKNEVVLFISEVYKQSTKTRCDMQHSCSRASHYTGHDDPLKKNIWLTLLVNAIDKDSKHLMWDLDITPDRVWDIILTSGSKASIIYVHSFILLLKPISFLYVLNSDLLQRHGGEQILLIYLVVELSGNYPDSSSSFVV